MLILRTGTWVLGVCVLGLLAPFGAAVAEGEKKKEPALTVEQITKVYAEDPAGYDKKYAGKAVVVEGVVAYGAVDFKTKDGLVVLRGSYKQAGSSTTLQLNCAGVAEREDLRPGHKVLRIWP